MWFGEGVCGFISVKLVRELSAIRGKRELLRILSTWFSIHHSCILCLCHGSNFYMILDLTVKGEKERGQCLKL